MIQRCSLQLIEVQWYLLLVPMVQITFVVGLHTIAILNTGLDNEARSKCYRIQYRSAVLCCNERCSTTQDNAREHDKTLRNAIQETMQANTEQRR